MQQVAAAQLRPEPGEHRVEMPAHPPEGGGVRALEAVDRLLLVADHEDRAHQVAGRCAHEELRGDRLDHPPLRRAGVLGLVDQDVVEPAVEPPEHPGGGLGPLEKPPRPVDQIIEVEPAERRLAGLVLREPGAGEAVERDRAVERGEAETLRPRRRDTGGEGVEFGDQVGVRGARRLGGKAVARHAGVVAGLHQNRRLERGELRLRAGREAGRGEPVAGLRVVAARGKKDRRDAVDQTARVGVEHAVAQRADPVVGIDVERRGEGAAVDRGREGVALGGDLPEEPVDLVAREVHGHCAEDRALRRGDRVERPGAQRLRLAFLEHLEARRDVRLEREAPQQQVAERMDRLDLEPSRRLQRPGEERARPVERLGRDLAGLPEVRQGGAQRRVVEHRPGPERPEEPVLHLRRGGARVGQAEDLARLGASQQEARHPVGQHPGLAGAGVGRDPARLARSRRRRLGLGDGAHARSSPTGASASDHSPYRERWS